MQQSEYAGKLCLHWLYAWQSKESHILCTNNLFLFLSLFQVTRIIGHTNRWKCFLHDVAHMCMHINQTMLATTLYWLVFAFCSLFYWSYIKKGEIQSESRRVQIEPTQMSNCVMTTSPSWQAACSAVRGSDGDPASWALICSLVLCARRSSSLGRSLSVTADNNHIGIPSSESWDPRFSCRAATNARCSYLARIHDSLSSLWSRQTQESQSYPGIMRSV